MSNVGSTVSAGENEAADKNPPHTKQGGVNSINRAEQGGVNSTVSPLPNAWMGLDYLTVSSPRVTGAKKLFAALAGFFGSSREAALSENGYHGVDVCGGHGALLIRQCRDSADCDLLVRLPGQAMEWLRESKLLAVDKESGDEAICAFFRDHDFRATRIDTTIDTSDPEVSPGLILKHLRERAFTARARKAGTNDSWKLCREKELGAGETVYIGGRSSTRFLRCYDKQAEVFNKLSKKIGHMTRFELENKHAAADRIMKLIAENGVGCIPAVIKGWISFKTLDDTSTRLDRRQDADWWQRLVGPDAPVTLGLTRGIATPEQAVHWIKHQASKTLYLAKEYGLMPDIEQAVRNKAGKVRGAERKRWAYYADRLKAGSRKESDEKKDEPKAQFEI